VGAATSPVTDDTFEREVLGSEVPVLVDFWADWCGPCKQVAPVLDELATEHADKLRIVKLNIDENPKTMERYFVRGVPTMMLFAKGEKVTEIVGALPKSRIWERLEAHL
jgi:thioredoxin 1